MDQIFVIVLCMVFMYCLTLSICMFLAQELQFYICIHLAVTFHIHMQFSVRLYFLSDCSNCSKKMQLYLFASFHHKFGDNSHRRNNYS